MDGKMLARLGAVVFVAVAVTATAIEMTRKEEAPASVGTAATVADRARRSAARGASRRCQQPRRGRCARRRMPARLGRNRATASSAGAHRARRQRRIAARRRAGGIMGGTGVIDHFLEVFTRYIDSGFGLLGGEVAFIATTLIVIDVTLAALFWTWGADDDIIARLVKKTLFVGVFAYLIGNWNNLARIVFESFAGLGLKASRHRLLGRRPAAPRQGRADRPRCRPAAARIHLRPDGLGRFFENFIQIACLLFAWALVLLAFFILAIQLFVTLIEFKLTTLAGFVLIPFGLFGKTAFMAERVLGNVISSGIKVLVLAVIIGIGSTLFGEFTAGFGGADADHRRRHGDRAGRAVAARPRHLRPRHRQRPRLRRSAARRRRRGRHRPCRGRHGVAAGGGAVLAARGGAAALSGGGCRRARRRRRRRRRLDRLQPRRRRPDRRGRRRLRPRRRCPRRRQQPSRRCSAPRRAPPRA